jgi:hypothetical protein
MRRVLVAAIALGAWQAYGEWRLRSLDRPPGVLAPAEPQQTPPGPAAHSFSYRDYTLQPMAHYRISARLLHREPYHFGRDADLAPLDFALGWGPMSDSAILSRLKLEQSSRFFSLYFDGAPPLPVGTLLLHSANTHLIPADDGVWSSLRWMRPGQVVELEGELVNISAPDGWYWNTSLTRTDTGAGACEVLWVEHAWVSG